MSGLTAKEVLEKLKAVKKKEEEMPDGMKECPECHADDDKMEDCDECGGKGYVKDDDDDDDSSDDDDD